MKNISRRDFMKHTGVYSTLGVVAPQFLTRTAEAATQSIAGFNNDRVLVVVQLAGGNDGLNMLVPYTDDAYHNARPQLRLEKDRLIKLNDDLAFNKKFASMKNLYDNGQLSIIQGVGYPNPNRSHFRSMEIWHTASESDEYESSGWIGRYFDHECSGSAQPQVGVAFGKERPQAFSGEKGYGVSFEDPLKYGWHEGAGEDTLDNFTSINQASKGTEDNVDFLRHVTSSAILSSKEVRTVAERAKQMNPSYQKGKRPLGKTLSSIAGLIQHDLSTRIYYVSAGGFDTHAGQSFKHDALLENVGTALENFQKDLTKNGTASRVTTMVFSEFGRRVAENKSGGTDHGTAAPMFLMGENVHAGLHGTTPSLTDLDQGDLKFTIDFRGVYASVLEDWFKVDSTQTLGRSFKSMELFS